MKYIFVIFLLVMLLGEQANGWRRRRRGSPPPPPIDCTLSNWGSWTRCTHQCGTAGTQSRTRLKLRSECCGGKCWPLRETRPCNRENCRNRGTPIFERCSCRGGYTGTCCETDICSTRPCQHSCINLGHTYLCKCNSCYTKVGTRCKLQQCKIGGKCFRYGDLNPSNQCQDCRQGFETVWTNNNTLSCSDGKLCTKNDSCVDGVCKGTPFTCKSCESCDGKTCRVNPGYCLINGRCDKNEVNGLPTPALSDCVIIDHDAPQAGKVNDGVGVDEDYQSDKTAFNGNWFGFRDEGSGIGEYRVMLTDRNGSIVRPWRSTGLAKNVSFTGLHLVHGTTYFLTVRAFDRARNYVDVKSDGVTVDTSPPIFYGLAVRGRRGRMGGKKVVYIRNRNRIVAVWPKFVDVHSGVKKYQWSVVWENREPSTWKDLPEKRLSRWVVLRPVSLRNNQKYRLIIRATNNAGLHADVMSAIIIPRRRKSL